MTDSRKQALAKAIAEGNVVIIVGTGASMQATNRAPAASWPGLLELGVQYAETWAGLDTLPKWGELQRDRLADPTLHNLLDVATDVERVLKAPNHANFTNFLCNTIGTLKATDLALPHALAALHRAGAHLATTNYDDLLASATNLRAVAWTTPTQAQDVLRNQDDAILHLHGWWRDPASIVLGQTSYDRLLRAEHAQALQHAISLFRTIIFVGCGDGLADPNFGHLLNWLRTDITASNTRHYLLCRDSQQQSFRDTYGDHPHLAVIAYGPDHADLPAYLHDLAPPATSLPPSSTGGAGGGPTIPNQIPAPRPHQPILLPYPALGPLFTGREPFLATLRTTLTRTPTGPTPTGPTPTGHAAIVNAMHGMGGVGKTRTAVEYAWRHRATYTALLFVIADAPEALRRNLAALAETLNLPERTAPEEPTRLTAVLHWLTAHPGWLLILDNVDTPAALAETERLLGQIAGGHVLLTSRLANFAAHIAPLELAVLARADATAFLLARTESRRAKTANDEAQADTLAGELDGLAIALEHAGAYIARQRIGFAHYLVLWRDSRATVLDWSDPAITHYPRALAQTWATSAAQLSAPARHLLHRLAFLAPDPVPAALLDVPIPDIPPEDLRTALADLEAFSLVSRDTAIDSFAVHRLVQDTTSRSLGPQAQAPLAEALAWVNAAFDGNPQDVRTWQHLTPLAPHAATVTARADATGIAVPTARLMNHLAGLLQAKALLRQAEPLYRRALAINEASHGPHHPDVAANLNNLATLLRATNRLAKAEPLLRRALAITESSHDPDHPTVATRLNNLAELLRATNRLAEAEPLYRRALAIDEASHGTDHPDVARDLNNLALLLGATNRLAEAEPLYRRALAIDEASYGPDHPTVATGLNNLAGLLCDTNRLAEAEPLYRRALTIDEASYGPDHPDVATRLANLAALLSDTNGLAEAQPLARRAVAILEAFARQTGHRHPNHDGVLRTHAAITASLAAAGAKPDPAG